MKIAVIFHRLGPYHVARLEAAARRCEVLAVELSSETGEYDWAKICATKSFARATLFPEGDSRAAAGEEVQRRVEQALHECRPDAVAIPGWSDQGALAALRWCSTNATPVVLMSESGAHDETRVWWKELVKRRVVGLCSTALVGGARHQAYLEQLGLAHDRIFTGFDVVDNGHFTREKAEKLKLRNAEMGGSQPSALNPQPASPHFLASARFIEKKNLPALLRAFAAYREAAGADAWNLVLLGDGPLRPALNSQLSTLNLTGSVSLPGFKQYDELPEFYARASAFVHASSTEQWGLVVNEACAAGLPVIVSERCGCAPELGRSGVNGFTFDPANEHALAACLLEMTALTEAERARFGAASSEIVSHFEPARFGEGLLRAASLALISPRKPAGIFDRFLLDRLLRR